jgi:hypothetical protein
MKINFLQSMGVLLIALAIVGVRIYFIQRSRDVTMPSHRIAPPLVSNDDLVKVRRIYPVTLADARTLVGKSVWVSAPGQFNYFPATPHHADYVHPVAALRGADELQVKDVFEQVAPHPAPTRVPTGSRQVLLQFTFANDAAAKLYAVPIGYVQNGYNLYLDDYFYYDDPHQMYHWPADTWTAIDQHKEIKGMNELQSTLSVGPVTSVESNDVGNRTETFYNAGTPLVVTFSHNKATAISSGQ